MGPACRGTTWPELQVTIGPVFGGAKAAARLPPTTLPLRFPGAASAPAIGPCPGTGLVWGVQMLQAPKVTELMFPASLLYPTNGSLRVYEAGGPPG